MASFNQQMSDAAKSMASINAPLAEVAKAGLQTHVSLMSALAGQAFECFQRVIDLNVNAARASLEDSTVVARQLLSAKDPQEFMSMTLAQAQPATAKAIAYSRHLANIASNAQNELAHVAREQASEANRAMSTLVEQFSKSAPAGSENTLALMKSVMANASASYEQFAQTGRQAAKAVESGLTKAVGGISLNAEQESQGRAHKH